MVTVQWSGSQEADCKKEVRLGIKPQGPLPVSRPLPPASSTFSDFTNFQGSTTSGTPVFQTRAYEGHVPSDLRGNQSFGETLARLQVWTFQQIA